MRTAVVHTIFKNILHQTRIRIESDLFKNPLKTPACWLLLSKFETAQNEEAADEGRRRIKAI